MKDASNYISTELFTLLNGNLAYDSVNVPVYSITQDVGETASLFVNLTSSYITSEIGTKDAFIRPYSVNLDVVALQANKSEAGVDKIANDIGVLVKPSPSVFGITGNADFNIINCTVADARSFQDRSDTMWRIRKVLTIEFIIKQL